MLDDTNPAEETSIAKPVDSPPVPEKENKVKRTTSKVRNGPKRAAAPKKAKAAKAAKPVRAKVSNGNGATRTRLDPEARVTATGKDNPFRENSGSYKRVETVYKLSGQTVKSILSKGGLKPTTLSTMKNLGLVKIG